MGVMNKSLLFAIYALIITICVSYLYKYKSQSQSQSFYIPTIKNRAKQDTSKNYIQKWEPNFKMYNNKEIEYAKQYSKDSMLIDTCDSDIEKVNKIAKHLVLKLHHQLGNPIDTVFEMTPWQQFMYIKNGKSQLYCTQYSLIFSFFCRINNLITRRIECFGTNDRHTFNEVFIKQSHEWIYNDLTHNIAYIKWEQHYMSFIDLFQILHGKINNQLFVPNKSIPTFNQLNFVLADTNKKVPTDTLFYKLLYSFDKNSFYHYHKEVDINESNKLSTKLKRYLMSNSQYDIFNKELEAQFHFYVKYIALLLITIVLFFLVRLIVKK